MVPRNANHLLSSQAGNKASKSISYSSLKQGVNSSSHIQYMSQCSILSGSTSNGDSHLWPSLPVSRKEKMKPKSERGGRRDNKETAILFPINYNNGESLFAQKTHFVLFKSSEHGCLACIYVCEPQVPTIYRDHKIP